MGKPCHSKIVENVSRLGLNPLCLLRLRISGRKPVEKTSKVGLHNNDPSHHLMNGLGGSNLFAGQKSEIDGFDCFCATHLVLARKLAKKCCLSSKAILGSVSMLLGKSSKLIVEEPVLVGCFKCLLLCMVLPSSSFTSSFLGTEVDELGQGKWINNRKASNNATTKELGNILSSTSFTTSFILFFATATCCAEIITTGASHLDPKSAEPPSSQLRVGEKRLSKGSS